ncbi:hypothetical protein ABT186_05200 [Streptomyces sp. NPDC001634]|uniref:hypothetical protein n=1 Tax=Streptomyces sp. NPDC001634 TaxID=3154390 RepID=UPI003322BB01
MKAKPHRSAAPLPTVLPQEREAVAVAQDLIRCALRNDVRGMNAILRRLDPANASNVIGALAVTAARYLSGGNPEMAKFAGRVIAEQLAGDL